MSFDRLGEFLPNSNVATILQPLTEVYIRSAGKVKESQYRTMLIGTVRAVVLHDLQREDFDLERETQPDVLVRVAPLATAACLARLELVKLFSSLGLTTGAELSDLNQREELKTGPRRLGRSSRKRSPRVPGTAQTPGNVVYAADLRHRRALP